MKAAAYASVLATFNGRIETQLVCIQSSSQDVMILLKHKAQNIHQSGMIVASTLKDTLKTCYSHLEASYLILYVLCVDIFCNHF